MRHHPRGTSLRETRAAHLQEGVSLPVLIDGHNLIGRMSTLSLQDPDDEKHLVWLLASYRARTGRRITVVFDPGGGPGLRERRHYAGIEVIFAPAHRSADGVIADRIRQTPNPGEWLVVTSDRNLGESVARYGARVRDAGEFAGELGSPPEETMGQKETPLTPQEVDDWLSLFEGRD